jgi:hypothetical protein
MQFLAHAPMAQRGGFFVHQVTPARDESSIQNYAAQHIVYAELCHSQVAAALPQHGARNAHLSR